MDRAEGTSVWRVGDREINADDDVRVDDERAVWFIEAHGTGRTQIVEARDPGARRFLQGVLRAKAAIAQREIVRPAPKPERGKRRAKAQGQMIECPACDGTGPVGCLACGGEGWVRNQG